MRARALIAARFALYAVVIASGVYYLVTRDDARGADAKPPGAPVYGRTTQQLPIEVRVRDHRVVAVNTVWRASCDYGADMTMDSGFVDAFEGDFDRDGQRFADEWTDSNAGWRDQTGHLHGRLTGESTDGTARGTVHFTLEVEENGRVVQTCASGPVGFAVDLP